MNKPKFLLPVVGLLVITLLGGCKKETEIIEPAFARSENAPIVPLLKEGADFHRSQMGGLYTLTGVPLGQAGNFTVLSKSGITNVYKSFVSGNVGSSPISGTATLLTCGEVAGTIYSVDPAGPLPCVVMNPTRLTMAVSNMEAAYTNAAGRTNPNFFNLGAGDIGGRTLTPGLYKWTSTLTIPTDIIISGGPNDVWIFQVSGTLTMASAVQVILREGAQAKNIFWQVSGAVTLGTYSHFEGIILGATGINMQTGGTINGRLLAQTAVTLQMNTIVEPN